VFLQVWSPRVDLLACQKNGQQLISPFADLIADGFQFKFMAKVQEGVLPRLRMQIDGVNNVPSISKITALTIAPTPSARVNPWREAVFQGGTKDTER
jgi:hypothetical protein